MANCRKCNQPISFIKRFSANGVMKWWPVEPDGTNHFDKCREYQTAAMTPEQRAERAKADQRACPPASRRNQRVTHVYCGILPPWDDFFGEYRDFTPLEKQLGVICRRR